MEEIPTNPLLSDLRYMNTLCKDHSSDIIVHKNKFLATTGAYFESITEATSMV